jgi:hypothetical protein
LRRSREAFDQCRNGLESLKQAGRLVPVDASYLREVSQLIRQIDSQSAALEASLRGSSGTKAVQNRGKTP